MNFLEMKIHDNALVREDSEGHLRVTRVPGGLLYETLSIGVNNRTLHTCFVPLYISGGSYAAIDLKPE